MSAPEEEYEQATPEQKLNIANYFIQQSPINEVKFVVEDVAKLINDDKVFNPSAKSALLAEYNVAQMVHAEDPEKPERMLLVCAPSKVSDTEFADPDTGRVLTFDHIAKKFTGVSDKKPAATKFDDQRKLISDAVGKYVSDCYKANKCVAGVYSSDNGDITVCLSSINTNLNAFWTGNWRITHTINVSSISKVKMTSTYKINVHYFEDGNVQLHDDQTKDTEVDLAKDGNLGKVIVGAMSNQESNFQEQLEEVYIKMHHQTFNQMRRVLPLSKQLFNWQASGHSVADALGKA